MRRRFSLIAAACVAGLLAGMPRPALAADVFISAESDSGPCAESWVLGRITEKFRYQVRHVPNLPDVEISEFSRIHQHRYLPQREDRPIGRRYCGATAHLSDGRQGSVWYLIEEGMGIIGIGDNVEFCVSGFDRWYVYNGRCRVLW
jgi:capsid protein